MKNNNKKRIPTALWLVPLLVFIAYVVFFTTYWLGRRYEFMSVPQFLYQMKTSSKGTEDGLFYSAVVEIGCWTLIAVPLTSVALLIAAGYFQKPFSRLKFYVRYCATGFCKFMKRSLIPIALIAVFFAAGYFSSAVHLGGYIVSRAFPSDFYEEKYVDPAGAKLTFPEKKRNVIYIFLESMEATYMDAEMAGVDYIPELSKLAKDNISFAGGENGKTGGLSYEGSTWTAAAMVAQTSGVSMQVPLFANSFGTNNAPFMPGIHSIGDILEKEGYNQTLLIGSYGGFACRDAYFNQHGNYDIIDTSSIFDEDYCEHAKDYWVWWGYEDAKLFDYAKAELLELAAEDKPFNFTMLTADTHFPNGYTCDLCVKDGKNLYHENQYANVLACSSKQVDEFVSWIKAQDFYEDTTIIIAGDHPTMDPDFLSDVIEEDYVRGIYNCIINPADGVALEKGENRAFSTCDMFPTTLAAMGVKIEGDRLALGTNLFSDTPTLSEEYESEGGFDALNRVVHQRSDYYDKHILGNDEKNK